MDRITWDSVQQQARLDRHKKGVGATEGTLCHDKLEIRLQKVQQIENQLSTKASVLVYVKPKQEIGEHICQLISLLNRQFNTSRNKDALYT